MKVHLEKLLESKGLRKNDNGEYILVNVKTGLRYKIYITCNYVRVLRDTVKDYYDINTKNPSSKPGIDYSLVNKSDLDDRTLLDQEISNLNKAYNEALKDYPTATDGQRKDLDEILNTIPKRIEEIEDNWNKAVISLKTNINEIGSNPLDPTISMNKIERIFKEAKKAKLDPYTYFIMEINKLDYE